MPIIIRIDVDNPFGWKRKDKLILNYISLNWTTVLNRVQLGYLSYAHELFNYLKSSETAAVWFFTLRTLPDKDFLMKIKESNQEIALHAIRSDTFENFNNEVKKINSRIGGNIRGFSKHGSGLLKLSRHHTPGYDIDIFLDFAQKTKLDYFIGNSEIPSPPMKTGEIFYWTGCFWANPERRNKEKYDLNWLKINCKEKTIVFIIHPLLWFFNQEIQKNLEWVITNISEIQVP